MLHSEKREGLGVNVTYTSDLRHVPLQYNYRGQEGNQGLRV